MSTERVIEFICQHNVLGTKSTEQTRKAIHAEICQILSNLVIERGGDSDIVRLSMEMVNFREVSYEPGILKLHLDPDFCKRIDEAYLVWRCDRCRILIRRGWHPREKCDEEAIKYIHEV